ncbi:hypothetical protein QM797_00440 [Rhodococcus sp. IEGM 1381]|nr:hypothetical protein [Rhodococcus sp. IEGM 1381]MDI9893183.1 hypothetical protein [Rhodococcus sp. IEGM 1381]
MAPPPTETSTDIRARPEEVWSIIDEDPVVSRSRSAESPWRLE